MALFQLMIILSFTLLACEQKTPITVQGSDSSRHFKLGLTVTSQTTRASDAKLQLSRTGTAVISSQLTRSRIIIASKDKERAIAITSSTPRQSRGMTEVITTNSVQVSEVKLTSPSLWPSVTKQQHLTPILMRSPTTLHVSLSSVTLPRSSVTATGTQASTQAPSPPRNITLLVKTSRSIQVSWEEPEKNNGNITTYIISYGKGGLEAHVNTTKTKYLLDGLEEFTLYSVQVTAKTSILGNHSGIQKARTMEDAPSSDPVIKKGQNGTMAKDAHKILVVWEEIEQKDQNGEITGYTVFYNESDDSKESSKNTTANKTSILIEGLKPYTTYCIKVAGYTKVGRSPLDAACYFVTTLQKAPSPPRNITLLVKTSRSILVSWEEPEKKNGKITAYIISYGKGGPEAQVNTTKKKYLLDGLEEFTLYSVQVTAKTTILGNHSGIQKARTMEDAPSSDPVIKKGQNGTMAKDAHTIKVVWEEIEQKDQNGEITGYTVFYNESDDSKESSKNTTANETSILIVGLKPYTTYCIKVAGYTKVGRSPLDAACYFVRTLQKGPSEPQDVTVNATSSMSILVSWKEPVAPNGVISEYWIYFGQHRDVLNETRVGGSDRSRELSSLRPYTMYYIKVRAKTTELGNASVLLNETTLQDSPSAPTQFHGNVYGRHANLFWNEPVNKNGIVTKYLIKVYMAKTGKVAKRQEIPADALNDDQKRQAMITKLMPFTNYTFAIQAFTKVAGKWAKFTATTKEEAPGKPREVTARLQPGGSILVDWKHPEDLNGRIISYQIYFNGKREYDPKFQKSNETKIDGECRFFEIMERVLDPGTEYTVYMTASTSIGEGNRSDSVKINTPAKAPLPPARPEVRKITKHSVQLKIKPASDSNGKVMFHEIIVERLGRRRKRESLSLPHEIHGFHEGKRFYVAANLSRESFGASKEFVLGDGKTYGGYENAELEPGTKYRAYIRGITEANGKLLYGKPVVVNQLRTLEKDDPSAAKSDADNTVGIIAGVLGTLVFIVIIIIAILLYKRSNRERNPNLDVENKQRKRRDFEFKRLSSKKKVLAVPADDYPPIPVEQFAKHVAKLHKSDDRGYMIEFNKLDSGQDYESSVALLPENKQKNRYANIIAYDHSRVALTTVDGIEGSDYINASMIAGYNKPNAYIATQGPVPPAFDDFWRMVWEKQSVTIIMLTNLQERHQLKCHKYWPDETEDYGDISVMLVKSEHYSDYIIRTFNIKRESEKEEREVKQFHFTVWPDHGVPEYPTALLAFRRRVRAYNPEDAGPMIVHCSAGVGRTGTFVVVDSTLDRIKAENTIEIFNYVAYLRTRRTAMVQTEGQYTFCHDAILEALQCGNTQIYAHDLRITLARMDEVNKNDNMTPFEAQFKTLNKVSPTLNKGCYLVASFAENKMKNRSQDVLAPDFSRVVLTAIDDNEATSYINAVHIPGYKQQHAFIVTHHPLTSTITDFWRMLCEQECSCVVLFDSSEEDGDFPLFWPEDEATYDDMITVKRLSASGSSVDNLKANYDQAQVAETSFKAADLRTPEKSLRIKMFKFSAWIEEEKIPAYSALIALIAKVEKWQQHSGNGPIAVVCSDGLGRSGTFCALYSVLERLKIEQVVDVFQAIKAMRIPRPGLVKSAAEYRFIHFAIQEYLSAFDDYANFKP